MTATARKAEPEIIPPKAKAKPKAPPKKNEVAIHNPQPQAMTAPVGSDPELLKMIAALARDKDADVDKFDRLLALRDRDRDREAKRLFDFALARMQPHIPVVSRRGTIEIRAKGPSGERDGKILQSSKYALWEDINEAIKPILGDHGFGLSFRSGDHEGKIKVTGILSHEAGHREETSIILQHDSTGSKNTVQAVGSTVSYGKRYTAGMLLNITSRGEDDDGEKGGGDPLVVGDPLTDAQATEVVELAAAVGCPGKTLLKRLNETKPDGHPVIEALEDVPGSRFAECLERLRVFEANKKARDASKTEGAK